MNTLFQNEEEIHPDLHPGDIKAEAKFKDVVEAYEILGNGGKRKKASEVKAKKARTQTNTSELDIQKKQQGNPLDMTKMFEQYMRIEGYKGR